MKTRTEEETVQAITSTVTNQNTPAMEAGDDAVTAFCKRTGLNANGILEYVVDDFLPAVLMVATAHRQDLIQTMIITWSAAFQTGYELGKSDTELEARTTEMKG